MRAIWSPWPGPTATATLPYIVYLMTVIAYVARRSRMAMLPEAFNLGRWAKPVMYAALAWLLVALGALMIPKDFWGADAVVAIVFILAATWYYAVLRGRLRRGEAGVANWTNGMSARVSAAYRPTPIAKLRFSAGVGARGRNRSPNVAGAMPERTAGRGPAVIASAALQEPRSGAMAHY